MTRRNIFTGLPTNKWFTAQEVRTLRASRDEAKMVQWHLYRLGGQWHGLVSNERH